MVSVGAMNCLTDIGGRIGKGKNFLKDYNVGNSQVCGSIYVSAVYKYAIGLRLEATLGSVKAYDSILKSVASTTQGRYERNLSFRSPIREFAIIAEIYPLFLFTDWSSKDREPPKFSPYLLGGIGYFGFNPQAEYNGTRVALQPLHTEGQGYAEYPNRKPYKLHQVNFPLGFGFKYEVSPLVNIRAEMVYRVLKTDYLDDVSTRYIDPILIQQDNSLSTYHFIL
ncbi:MAG: hypothetical protein HY305_05345 [Sphingobacteriales bacterium]|nr:hypothetical protein [Sphingobacteriales bacterium]